MVDLANNGKIDSIKVIWPLTQPLLCEAGNKVNVIVNNWWNLPTHSLLFASRLCLANVAIN